ncbi:ABC transporter ATP-binding protein [Brachybacterium sp. EF45031]|uniref:ABC transporter ATP-binding protein n=1 Tax=Brachybacterium sillae TaxID=2810536 RepID=UPI00217E6A6F|nr:ABC transporter ATP-binding protein [Brachybacterium sillae]MCS6712015.1 ABC transporter ATP-binding protein [Brachybacterium sillae]
MAPLVRIVRFTRALTPFYLAIVACSILTAVAELAAPFLLGRATDTIAGSLAGRVPADDAVRTVILLAVGLLVVEVASSLFSNVGGWFGDVMSNRMRAMLSVRYFEKLLVLPQRWFDTELTGTIVARLNRSITEVTNFAKMFSNMFATTLITTVAVIAISAWYWWPLAVLLIIVFPLYVWLTSLTSTVWQRLEGEKNEHVDIASGRFAEVIGQIRVVKSFAHERGELRSFAHRFGLTDRLTRTQSTHWHKMDVLRRTVLNLVFFGLYAIIFARTAQGAFTLGEMVLLLQLIAMVRQPVQSMSYIIDTAQRAIAGSRDYFSVMGTPADDRAPQLSLASGGSVAADSTVTDSTVADPAPSARPGASTPASSAPAPAVLDIPQNTPAITFDRVHFAYETGEDVLHDVTLDVKPGERVALVGESGGGKSTIVNLLLGLYVPREGCVRVGGRDLADIPVETLRRSIGVVFQDASLFSGTIRENIAYGRPGATDEEVRAAARRANADRFIERFTDGYDTIIGERGLKLSGGQRQRIAVARAILKDAPILVLDEATSALDTKAERQVQAGLEELMAGRTSLIIAHRLSTIAGVDRIVTLRDGRVDEIGTPAELSRSGGIYAELLALQSAGSAKQLAKFDIHG